MVLTVNEQHRLDIVMQLGSLQQEVLVEANAVQVETAATQMGNVINDKAMVSLPLIRDKGTARNKPSSAGDTHASNDGDRKYAITAVTQLNNICQ